MNKELRNAVEMYMQIEEDTRNYKNSPYSEELYVKREKMFKILKENKIEIKRTTVYSDNVSIAKISWKNRINTKTLCVTDWKVKITWEVN